MSAKPDVECGFIPYLIVRNAKEAIALYEKSFGGEAGFCLSMKDGTIAHAEVKVGSARLMLAEEKKEWNMRGAQTLGECPLTLVLYVADVDAVTKQAQAAGMKVIKEPENHFFGDRMATLEDPYGYIWSLGTHVEDVNEAEMQSRMSAIYEPET